MERRLLFVTVILSQILLSLATHQVLRFTTGADPNATRLVHETAEKYNFDLWASNPAWSDVMIPASAFEQVSALGVPFSVIMSDVESYVEQHLEMVKEKANADFFSTYRNFGEIRGFFDELAALFPSIVKKVVIGTTIQGRDIAGIAVTSPNAPSAKRAIVLNGGQHAREWISPMTNAWIANQLVTQYGRDPTITKLMEAFEWTIIPVVNGDGYAYSWENQNTRLWRKNRRENQGSTCIGVDTNRNWNFHWNEGGSSPNPCADTYHGPNGFSEPEETSLAQYIKSKTNVIAYIDFHSYSQLWMNPWSYTVSPPADDKVQQECAKVSVAALAAVHGTQYTYGSIAPTLYVASGASVDWAYGVAGVKYSYVVELRDTGRYGFLLPPDQIIPTGEETMAGVIAMALFIQSQP